MEKIIVIGDIHGRTIWKDIVEKESDADKIIFIGDYLDSWNHTPKQMADNFLDIEAFKVSSDKEVILLMGNHDLSYISPNLRCSGYSVELDELIGNKISNLFRQGFIKTFHIEENILFSHAGVTKTWLNNLVNYLNVKSINVHNQINFINQLAKGVPSILGYVDSDKSGYGFSIDQGPLWVRPKSMLSDRLDNLEQIVGHTSHNEITMFGGDEIKNRVIFIDVFDNINQYLVIEFTDNKLYHKYSIKEIDIIKEEIDKITEKKTNTNK